MGRKEGNKASTLDPELKEVVRELYAFYLSLSGSGRRIRTRTCAATSTGRRSPRGGRDMLEPRQIRAMERFSDQLNQLVARADRENWSKTRRRRSLTDFATQMTEAANRRRNFRAIRGGRE